MNNYMRFKTPQISLTGLLNEENRLSPFYIIAERLELIQNGENYTDHFNRIKYELRVLGSIMKSTMRDQFQRIAEQLKLVHKAHPFNLEILSFLEEISSFQKKKSFSLHVNCKEFKFVFDNE